MNPESLREYCISLPAVTEEFPFDEQTLVFKVKGKMFALTDIDSFSSINLKCDPERAVELRELHESILPGYHMNKKHWNTLLLDGSLPDKLLRELILHSYQLVVAGLPKKVREELDELHSKVQG
ncbi:MmcQ/YjbR family DNA-binding protein [Cesiribacter sp. SM1]|uniref:MmcQ/YjbR family DNA-binding protein n=1 Tax=Cesiribacter sp. SM1 TaxID=2861196 RepID=UPI001CD3C185|nr:MmcQ/YjbR family DNA-binding protein [Cesiribacter sp. SM1]